LKIAVPEFGQWRPKLMSLIDVHEKEDDMIDNLFANRRDLLIAPLLATMPVALLGGRAEASPAIRQ
jgi:hypothetical protein